MRMATETIVNPFQQSKLNKKGLCDYGISSVSADVGDMARSYTSMRGDRPDC